MNAPSGLTGQLLFAMPGLMDPNFEHGVAFICQHGEDGAIGLLINRPSDFSLGDLLKQMQIDSDNEAVNSQPVLSGGPIQPERGFVLHHGHTRWVSSHPVNDELVLTTSRDVLEAIAAGEGPDPMLVALGYAGWEPGQLERELRENAWLTIAANSSLLFETPLDQRWTAAAASVGVDASRLMHYAGNA